MAGILQRIERIGDIILTIDDSVIDNPNDLNVILKKYSPGDKIIVKYLRDNQIKKSELKFGC